MAKKTSSNVAKKSSTGIVLVLTYLALFITNLLIILIANRLFPETVVLGTNTLSTLWSADLSMSKLALLCTLVVPFVHLYEERKGIMFTPGQWMGLYLIVNFVGLWLISRFAVQFGLGISAWWVALILAVVLDFFQGLAMMPVEKFRLQLEEK